MQITCDASLRLTFRHRKVVSGILAGRSKAIQTALRRFLSSPPRLSRPPKKEQNMRVPKLHPWEQTRLVAAIILTLASTLPIPANEAAITLPSKALAALNASYPKGVIREVEIEKERKLSFFSVTIALPDRVIEVEITGDGHLVETEEDVPVDAVPPTIRSEITLLNQDGHQVTKIEKHEIHSIPRLGLVRQLVKPVVYYELKIRDCTGTRRSALLEQDADRIIKIDKAVDDDDENDDNDDD
jgi:hypothetical protein